VSAEPLTDGSPFSIEEYRNRLEKVRRAMVAKRIDALVLSDPCNVYYLTGYDGWSFYTPQVLIVSLDRDPVWIGREMDVLGVRMLSWIDSECVIGYPDALVQNTSSHPFDYVARFLVRELSTARVIGVEKNSYYLTVQAYEVLTGAVDGAKICDASLLVNWIRFKKSPAEIELLKQAAQLLDMSMQAAIEIAEPGVRESEVAAAVYAANCRGNGDFGGVYTSSPAFIMSAQRTATPHLCWSDRPLEPDSSMNLELMGNRLRYQVTMARTVCFGNAPKKLKDMEAIVIEGIERTLDFIRPGVTCEEVEGVWRASIAKHGLAKESRCGYSLGIAYPPTGGELTASLRPGDKTVLQPGVAMHFLPAIWSESTSLTISEPFQVTETGCERLSSLPTRLIEK